MQYYFNVALSNVFFSTPTTLNDNLLAMLTNS